MTPEAQRIAIAEACGWKWVPNPVTSIGGYWERGEQGHVGYERGDWGSRELVVGLPDYLNDLNAMHEAEKVLTIQEQHEYSFSLSQGWRSDRCDNWRGCHATAAQRAEAFLKTKGLWK